MSALIAAFVGTDHHPFDRLVSWLDELALRLAPDTHVVVQYGASRPPLVAEGHAFLRQQDLRELLSTADAVVCHGGPGTVMDARNADHVPVCVARDPSLGEHVDGHQQRFVAMASRTGLVLEARSRPELGRLLAERIDRRHGHALDRSPTPDDIESASAQVRLASELDGVWGSRPARRSSLGRYFGSRVMR